MTFVTNCQYWAEDLFGDCDLGDRRRTDRLVDYAARQASAPQASTSQACLGDAAAREGAYRLLRNAQVRPEDIDDGAFDSVAGAASKHGLLLAIQDSTGVSFAHPVAQALRSEGNPTGLFVHSTLLVAAESRTPVGLVDQERWLREPKGDKPKGKDRRPYEEKESFKWEAAHTRLRQRMPSMADVITVCDRESDVTRFLRYLLGHEQRFVVRASNDRKLENFEHLWAHVESQPELGRSAVEIEQRGGQLGGDGQEARLPRKKRTALVTIRATQVELRCTGGDLKVNAVLVREAKPPKGSAALAWMLLTSEPVVTLERALAVVGYYETRWMIEIFHKAWKSGARVQERPFQTLDNLERMMAVTAHIAVRLLQLKLLGEAGEEGSCETVLSPEEWLCLHVIAKPGTRPPKRPPSARWALHALARLGGWYDTKRTGRIGWQTLWRGWQIFQERLIGWRMAMQTLGARA